MAEYRSIEDSRHQNYKYFQVKKPVTLYFETDSKTVKCIGYVESNEPGIFSSAEENQVSVICPDPWFYELNDQEIMFTGVEGMFEFPFSNESLTQKLIIFGEIKESLVETFWYRGEVEVGFVAEIEVAGDYQDTTSPRRIRIMNLDYREVLEIDTDVLAKISGGKLEFGDRITVSTVPGEKYAVLQRYGEDIDILNAVTRASDWPKIYPGENTFGYTAAVGLERLWFKIRFKVAYQGI